MSNTGINPDNMPKTLEAAQITVAYLATFSAAVLAALGLSDEATVEVVLAFDDEWNANESEFLEPFGLKPLG